MVVLGLTSEVIIIWPKIIIYIGYEISTAKGQKLIKATKRLEVIDAFKKSNQRPEWMILEAIPVIPADLRPMMVEDQLALTSMNYIRELLLVIIV